MCRDISLYKAEAGNKVTLGQPLYSYNLYFMLTFFCSQQKLVITALQGKKIQIAFKYSLVKIIVEIEYPLQKPAPEF